MKNGITFDEMADDLAAIIDEIEREYEIKKQDAKHRAATNFMAVMCGAACANGNKGLPEQIYRVMPYLKREGE